MARKKVVRTIIWLVVVLLGLDFLIIKIFDYFQIHAVGLSPQLILIIILDLPILGMIIGEIRGVLRGKPVDETTEQKMPGFFDHAKESLFRRDLSPRENFPDEPNILDESSVLSDVPPKSLQKLLERRKTGIEVSSIIVAVIFTPISVLCLSLVYKALSQGIGTTPWWQILLTSLASIILGVISVYAIWGAVVSIRNTIVFSGNSIFTQAKVSACWVKSKSGPDGEDEYFIKIAFSPTEATKSTDSMEVVAKVNYEIYKDSQNKNEVNIQYARNDPLIIKIEGESP